jgi:hypothetical protein
MTKENSGIDQWNELLKGINILGEPSHLTPSKFNELDYDFSVVLPKDYIYFLEVFGQGFLGESIRIRWPGQWSKVLIRHYVELLETYKNSGSYTEEDIKPNLDLLSNSFAFGDTDTSELLVWDLRTYSTSDDSYDIYWIGLSSSKSYLVGRDFYEFVSSFCFGEQMFDKLPMEEQLDSTQMTHTFTGYSDLHLIEGIE